ncbi:hypothetical protein ACVFVO_15985 [Advenella kashmirensis]
MTALQLKQCGPAKAQWRAAREDATVPGTLFHLLSGLSAEHIVWKQ